MHSSVEFSSVRGVERGVWGGGGGAEEEEEEVHLLDSQTW